MGSDNLPDWNNMGTPSNDPENELLPTEIQLRNRFVDEYLIDFSPYNAAIRIGYDGDFASQFAERFMKETYVVKRISILTGKEAATNETEEASVKRRVINGLIREANYRGPGSRPSSRVAALGKLASIYGMDAPTKSEHEHTIKGGVMAVPGIASVEDWEETAVKAQEKLANDTRH